MEKNYFTELSKIDLSGKVEKKLGLSYLSWAFAWGELKKKHPTANSKVYETESGRPYFDDGKTAWVKVSVTVEGIEHIEYFPIQYQKPRDKDVHGSKGGPIESMKLEMVTSFHVNTSIQRAITKAIARHGLGLYIYAGEDLPESDSDVDKRAEAVKRLKPEAHKGRIDNSGDKITKEQSDELQKLFASSIFTDPHGVRQLALYLHEWFAARNFSDLSQSNFDLVKKKLKENQKNEK